MDAHVLDSAIFEDYDGDRDLQSRQPNGTGRAVLCTGAVYQGEWADGLFHGQGTLEYVDGCIYTGQFVRGCQTGFGRMSYPDGSCYEGAWVNGIRHGHGAYLMIQSSGSTAARVLYEGEFDNGVRQGKGTIYYNAEARTNGPYYEGEITADRPHGNGRMVYASGAIYDGQWVHGVKCGFGVMTWPAPRSERYAGEWVDNQPCGRGECTWLESGNRYVGDVVAGKMHGHGVFYYADGSQFVGQWQNGVKQGDGSYVEVSGAVKRGVLTDDWWKGGGTGEEIVHAVTNGLLKMNLQLSDIGCVQMVEDTLTEDALCVRVLDVLARYIRLLRSVFDAYGMPGTESMALHAFWRLLQRGMPSVFRQISLVEVNRAVSRAMRTSPFVAAKSDQSVVPQMIQTQALSDMHCPYNEIRFREFCEALVRVGYAVGISLRPCVYSLTENLLRLLSELESNWPMRPSSSSSASRPTSPPTGPAIEAARSVYQKDPLAEALGVDDQLRAELMRQLRQISQSRISRETTTRRTLLATAFPLPAEQKPSNGDFTEAMSDTSITVREFLQWLYRHETATTDMTKVTVEDVLGVCGPLPCCDAPQRELAFVEVCRVVNELASRSGKSPQLYLEEILA